jgi:DNA-binding Xre family transcriptional regulator
MGVHPNAISSLKNQDNLPKIGGDTLDVLCHFLGCIPSDLIKYTPNSSRELAEEDDEE